MYKYIVATYVCILRMLCAFLRFNIVIEMSQLLLYSAMEKRDYIFLFIPLIGIMAIIFKLLKDSFLGYETSPDIDSKTLTT